MKNSKFKKQSWFVSSMMALCLVFITQSIFAQIVVSGQVLDESGLSLIGASIIEKETTTTTINGTQSDIDGKFSLTVSDENAVLVISYIGYLSKEIVVGQQTDFIITLTENATNLDEVVVIGYGVAKKSDLTGSISTVSNESLDRTINQSFQEALAGRTSGVQVLSGEGSPGGAISIRVRGGTSISASNEPLYVIDGFPIIDEREVSGAETFANTTSNALAGIDPKDIQSIQILKDASATAIYGSRGANGVVIITTKKGRAGQSKISYESYVSFKSLPKKIELLNDVQYAQYRKTQTEDDPTGEINQLFQNPSSFAGTGIDWQDEVYGSATLVNHRLGFSGGSQDIRYQASFGAFLDEGVIKGSSFDRYNARVNIDGKVNDRLTFSTQLTGAFSLQEGAPTGGANNERAGAVNQALFFPPINVSDTDEALSDLSGLQNYNPVFIIENTTIQNKTDLFLINASLTYDITDDLSVKILAGGNINNRRNAQYHSTDTGWGAAVGGRALLTQNSNRGWVNENTLTYKKSIDKHNFTVLGGFTTQAANIESFRVMNTAFDIQDLGFNNLGIGTSPQIPSSLAEDWSLMSGLGRVSYNFDQRYLVTASFRADGSSRFAEGNKWGYFPAVAVAWRLKNEDFLKNFDMVSSLKLRAGFGITGNQEVPRYRSLSSLGIDFYSFGLDNGNANVGVSVDRVSNPDLSWEQTRQYNFGIDFGLFDHKLTGTVDVYDKLTTDMLLAVNLIPTSGIASPALQNLGSLKNTGMEFALNYITVDNNDFTWRTGFNISFNKNEILDLGPNKEIFVDVPGGIHTVVNEVILRPGESIGTFYGYETDGIYGLPDNPTAGELAIAGTRRIVDQNGDGVINADDRVILGNALPTHYGGFTNDLTYKGLDLGIFFDWSYGNKVYNANRVYLEEVTNDGRNKAAAVANAWTPENQNTDITAIGRGENNRFIDRYVEDGSFIRLRSLSLGYTFDRSQLSNLPFSHLKIYISGQNLLTFTDYKGYNPESSIGSNPVTPGIDWGAYPLAKIYTVGINVNF